MLHFQPTFISFIWASFLYQSFHLHCHRTWLQSAFLALYLNCRIHSPVFVGYKCINFIFLSHIILSATDWTRPALRPLYLLPTIQDLCCNQLFCQALFLPAVHRLNSYQSLASLIAAFTALFVISLNVILYISLSSNFNAFERCHDIASPHDRGRLQDILYLPFSLLF